MSWIVYGIMRADTREVFYVGITTDLKRRLASHAADRQSAIYEIMREIETDHCVFAEFPLRRLARCLENHLIIGLPRTYNRTKWRDGVEFWVAAKASDAVC